MLALYDPSEQLHGLWSTMDALTSSIHLMTLSCQDISERT